MKTLILIYTIFTAVNSQIEVPCGNSTCTANNGICITVNNIPECVCNEGVITFPPEYPAKCNYTLKYRLTAFLLELFLTYGIGHFYAGNYYLAVPKMFFFCFSYCLFVFLRMVVRNNEYDNNTSQWIVVMAYVFCILMLGWYIADLVLYGLGIYKDGNGVDLVPW
jgi:hypothetical protein